MRPAAAVTLFVVFLGVSAQSRQAEEGTIEGVVVEMGTTAPIANARVIVAPASLFPFRPAGAPPAAGGAGARPEPPRNATTDATGRFVFDSLPPGAYRLIAMATGYVRQLGEGTRPIDVAPGQTVRAVQLAMQPAGTVSGRIRDLDGRPVAGISVQILRRSYDLLGDRTFQSAGSAVSDDRGEYRVSSVTPGRYYMLASSQMAAPGLRAASPNAPSGFSVLPTFYPNAAELDAAMALDVVSGTERSAIDFVVERQPLRRITGRVLEAATGAPPQAAQISVVTRSGTATLRRGPTRAYNPADGTFEVRDVPAGRHHVVAEIVAAGVPLTSPITVPVVPPGVAGGAFVSAAMRGGLVTASAHVPVDVSRADLDDLTIVVTAAFPVRGRVTLSGGAPPEAFNRLHVQLTPLRRSIEAQAPQPATIALDGSFEILHVLPGEYRVQVAGLHPDFYLESAQAGSVDVASMPLALAGAIADSLDIVVSARVSTIEGTVADARGEPVPEVRVVLVPVSRQGRLDLVSVARSGGDGGFEMQGVAPGEYRLFAAEGVDPFAFLDPDVMSRYESRGHTVRVSAASRQAVQVRLIQADRQDP